jgi:hypothetical protein
MTHSQRLALVLCSALWFITPLASEAQQLIPGQEYSTGNIVIPTNQGGPTSWTGSVYQNSLTCWTWGDPGYCGPSPIVRPNNLINFSFGSSYIYQQQNVSGLLPSSTPGLQVSGYNFSFTAKNGNGWDDGRVDQLTALVRFWDTTGGRGTTNLLYGTSYNLSYKFNWTNFNYSENLPTPLNATSVGQVQYGFLGKDNNGWAGPYGPEIYNVNFSLKYKVDPCTVDVLSSPTCPGYTTALLNSLPKTTTSTTTELVAPTTVVVSPTISTSSTPTVTETIAVPTQTTTSTTSSPVASTQSTSSTSSTPSATNPQPKVGEVTVSGSPAKTTMSTSQVLAIVKSEQTRIGNLETSTAQQATEQAQAASDKAQQESLSISAATVSQNQSSAQAAVSMVSSVATMNNNQIMNQSSSSSSVANMQSPAARSQSIYSLVPPTQTQTTTLVASVSPQVSYSINRNETFKTQEEPMKSEGIKFSSTDPIFNIINSPPPAQSTTQESQNTTTVNTKVKDNDAAGGVSLDVMAKQPKGFETYMSIIPDVAFYAPKDIYKGQVTVDNVRALRQLSSDRIHQQMVDQQYRK